MVINTELGIFEEIAKEKGVELTDIKGLFSFVYPTCTCLRTEYCDTQAYTSVDLSKYRTNSCDTVIYPVPEDTKLNISETIGLLNHIIAEESKEDYWNKQLDFKGFNNELLNRLDNKYKFYSEKVACRLTSDWCNSIECHLKLETTLSELVNNKLAEYQKSDKIYKYYDSLTEEQVKDLFVPTRESKIKLVEMLRPIQHLNFYSEEFKAVAEEAIKSSELKLAYLFFVVKFALSYQSQITRYDFLEKKIEYSLNAFEDYINIR